MDAPPPEPIRSPLSASGGLAECRCPLAKERNVQVADRVVFSPAGEVLVDGLGDHVVLVAVRAEPAAGVGRYPSRAGASADGYVAQPQLVEAEAGKIPAVRKAKSGTGATHNRQPADPTANRGERAG
jgi:hypothetical protein